jgi:hypothetical protein
VGDIGKVPQVVVRERKKPSNPPPLGHFEMLGFWKNGWFCDSSPEKRCSDAENEEESGV